MVSDVQSLKTTCGKNHRMGERPHSLGNMLALGSAVGDEGDTVIMSEFYLGNLKLKKK